MVFWTNGWTDGCIHHWMAEWMNGWMQGWLNYGYGYCNGYVSSLQLFFLLGKQSNLKVQQHLYSSDYSYCSICYCSSRSIDM